VWKPSGLPALRENESAVGFTLLHILQVLLVVITLLMNTSPSVGAAMAFSQTSVVSGLMLSKGGEIFETFPASSAPQVVIVSTAPLLQLTCVLMQKKLTS
jgi:hypothetical protein